uniref:VAMP-like protein YKT61 n=1 Tax=Lactuca sativa TaxID=4236 RepID=A0A9R1VFK4_LACSA|nr:hypothetical protein LSAT_V11C500261630 [Lactuca sativa]
MKITALLVLKCHPIPDGSDPVILANAMDVSHFGGSPSGSSSCLLVGPSPNEPRLTNATPSNTKVHSYNRNGLCVVGFMDDHYPVRSAFSVLNQVIDEYQKKHGNSWHNIQADITDQWPYLNDALTRFQDPAQADKLLKIQRELDETKIILHKTIDSVLERGEKLDSLVEKSSDLSAASQVHL